MWNPAVRFAAMLAAVIAGGLIVIAAVGFGDRAAAWITFGLAALVVLAALTAFAAARQGAVPRVVEVLLALVGAWTLLAARVFGGSANRWLDFAGGVALCALGAAGLLVHERLLEGELRRHRDLSRSDGFGLRLVPRDPDTAPQTALGAGAERGA
jgi:hypothetical protein